MKTLRNFGFVAVVAGLLMGSAHNAPAQIAVSIGEPPVCPYGYYEAPPYNCAPDGYYGFGVFSGGYLSELALGITGRAAFMTRRSSTRLP